MNRRTWKWIALVAASGTLLQVSSCAMDILYYLIQAAATQLIAGALTGGGTAGA
jgi:hypothetical protein